MVLHASALRCWLHPTPPRTIGRVRSLVEVQWLARSGALQRRWSRFSEISCVGNRGAIKGTYAGWVAARQVPSGLVLAEDRCFPGQRHNSTRTAEPRGGRHMVQRSRVRRNAQAGTEALVAPEGPVVTPGFHPLADFANFGPNEVEMLHEAGTDLEVFTKAIAESVCDYLVARLPRL